MADFEPIYIEEEKYENTIATLIIPKGNPNVQFCGGKSKIVEYSGHIHPNSPLFSSLTELKNAYKNEETISVKHGDDTNNYKITDFVYERNADYGEIFEIKLIEID